MSRRAEIEAALRQAELELQNTRLIASHRKRRVLATEGRARWNAVRASTVKGIYNRLERINALQTLKVAPNTRVLYNVNYDGIRLPTDLTGQNIIEPRRGEGRVFDAVQIDNDLNAQPQELKSKSALKNSIKGGISRGDVKAFFKRTRRHVGFQLAKETRLINKAKEVKGLIQISGYDAVTGEKVTELIQPERFSRSRLVAYGQVPDVILGDTGRTVFELPDADAIRAKGGVPGVGSRGTGPGADGIGSRTTGSAIKPPKATVRGQRLAKAASRAKELATGARQAARFTARGIGRLSVSAVRGVRFTTAFAFRMIIPPITPASLVFEVIVFIAFGLLSQYLQKKEEEKFKRALEKLPPQVDRKIKASYGGAATKMVEDFESGGTGFLYALVTAEIEKRSTTVAPSFPMVPKEEWFTTLVNLHWVSERRKSRVLTANSEKSTFDRRTLSTTIVERDIKRITFTIDEPIMTVFEYLNGVLETIRQLLLKTRKEERGVRGGIGPARGAAPRHFSHERFANAIKLIEELIRLLSKHREIEEIFGTNRARVIRKYTLLHQAAGSAKVLVKEVDGIIEVRARRPETSYLEALGLALQFRADVERAQRFPTRFFFYRTAEKVPEKQRADKYEVLDWKPHYAR